MKPMLAVEAPKELTFPLYASAKIDGIRATVNAGVLLSRTLKPIPNRYVQQTLGVEGLNGLDGELCVGPAYAQDLMQRTTSGVMSEDGEPNFTYWVFDYWTSQDRLYDRRLADLRDGMESNEKFRLTHPRVKLLEQRIVCNQFELDAFETQCLELGYEGLIVRNPNTKYKFGRSTQREGCLLKLKRFADGEAVVIGFEERMHNANEATINELGYTARSSHKAGMVPMNTLGALRVRDCVTQLEFNIGTGFVDAERKHIWDIRNTYLGAFVTYKHFKQGGVKTLPRMPVFKAFRDPRDMS